MGARAVSGVALAGIALGVISGGAAGLAVVCLLRAEMSGSRSLPKTLKIVAQLLAIPSAPLGCVASSKLLQLLQLSDPIDLSVLLPAFAVGCAATMVVIAFCRVVTFIHATVRDFTAT